MNGLQRQPIDLLVVGASEVLTCDGSGDDSIGRVVGGVVAVAGDSVVAVGPESEVRLVVDPTGARVIDALGGVVAPGFVDAHTHLVFGGSRVREYASRLTRTKEETKALGIPVGILATVEATRAATVAELTHAAVPRLDEMLAHGTTTVESKSGYGLTVADEIKLLEVNRLLDQSHPIQLISTFMGAHDIPPEMDRSADAGLAPKIHAEQYARTGGALLAAELGCTSADHLNFARTDDIEALVGAGVTAVLMPLIDFAVRHPEPIDANRWSEAGLTIALGTDMCPGGYAASMPLAIQFACRGNGLSPEQALLAATAGAAHACGLEGHGRLAAGAVADLQIWNVTTLEDMVYRTGHNPVRQVIKRGKVVHG